MKRVSLVLNLPLALALAGGLSTQAANAQTLKTVKGRGMLSCGVHQGLPGFSSPDDKGNWTGLDVDVCRAIAAAILNDPTKVKFVPLSAKDRFTALQSGEIDVLSRNTTWTLSRDTSLGANFTGVTYYDGQGFMVKKALKVNSALELNSASVCVQTGTTTQKNVDEMAKSDKPEMKRVFGTDGNLGEQLGLTKDWVSRIVKAVGNYGETFERNVGGGSKLGIARGLNALWNKGGIQYAPPIR